MVANVSEATKVEFGSAAFLDQLRLAFEAITAREEFAGLTFSLSEAYTGAPAHLSADGTGGFTVRMTNGTLTFEPEPSADVDVRVDGTYEAMLPLARIVVDGDAAKQQQLNALILAAMQAGHFRVTGDASKLPPLTAEVHDRVARVIA